MVIRLTDIPVWNDSKAAGRSGFQRDLASRLLVRANALDGVVAGGCPVAGITGIPLRLELFGDRINDNCFIRGRVFAVVGPEGSLCLRLPREIAEDLVDNSLGLMAGKNILTWPPTSEYQLETQWRLLQQAYWNVCGTPVKKTRRLWSEWVVKH